jgi:hypothetical protein
MLKKLLKMRANIWLTTGIIIVIAGLFFTSVVILSNVDPLSADARADTYSKNRGGEYIVTGGNTSFGTAGTFYTPSKATIWDKLRDWMARDQATQPRPWNQYPGPDPKTGRF